ncbi:MAG: TonB-dependent receptor [Ignavibacteriae bacterium]|nr:TonB-dependent receptor [Ignavibacteriota bacterium]
MKTLLIQILLFAICSNASSQVASSRDTVYSIEEIVVKGGRIETGIYWSPSSVKVLDERKISTVNGSRLSDILKTTGNVFMKTYGGDGSLSTISLNGLGAEHTLVLIDGKKINSFQNSQADLSLIPKDKIEKIEIMSNGASSLYGSNAIGGVINVITKSLRNDNPKAELSGTLGSYGYNKYSVNYGNSTGNLKYDLFYSREKSKGNFKYIYYDGTSRNERERNNNGFVADNLYLDLNYRTGKKNEIRFNSGFFSQKRDLPGIEAGTPSSSAQQRDINWNNNLSYSHFLNEAVSISSDLNYQNNLMKYTEPGLDESHYRNRVLTGLTTLSFKNKYFKNTSGFEVTYADISGSSFDETASRKQCSIFTAGEINVSDFLKLFPSLRYDYISDIGRDVYTGKFGLNFKPVTGINLNLRTSIGNNFSAPTFNELYWKNIGNRNLRPESSVNFDAGLIYRFDLITQNIIELNYTRIRLEDKIVWKPAEFGLWKPFNIDISESNIFSIEINSRKRFNDDFEMEIGYGYTYNSSVKKSYDYPGDASYGKQIFFIPVELSKMNLGVNYRNVSLNFFYSFTGKRYSDFENKERLPVIDLLDGNIGYTIKVNKITINTKFEINNVLNEDYIIIQGYPMPLRNYKINLSLIY